MLISIIPRLFNKYYLKLNEYNLLKNIYSSNYKHGFGLNLMNDIIFNRYYKIITNFEHI